MGRVCYKWDYPTRKPPNLQILGKMVLHEVLHEQSATKRWAAGAGVYLEYQEHLK